MALASHELNVVAGQDHAVAVEKKVYVDREAGIAAEVENVTVAVDLGDGNIGVVRQQRIVGVGQLETQVQAVNDTTDNAIVHHQPQVPEQVQVQPQTRTVQLPSEYATGALRLAIALTYFCLCIFCFWATPCSAVAWHLALAANSTHSKGKYKSAKRLKRCSIGWSIAAIVSAIIVPAVVITGTAIGLLKHFSYL